jgi:hypothetical protein
MLLADRLERRHSAVLGLLETTHQEIVDWILVCRFASCVGIVLALGIHGHLLTRKTLAAVERTS